MYSLSGEAKKGCLVVLIGLLKVYFGEEEKLDSLFLDDFAHWHANESKIVFFIQICCS